ncbi:MAG: hypothetical protein ACP5SI_05195 [Chloroflexia bacterium]
MDIRKAQAFVEAQGDGIARARAQALLEGTAPPSQVVNELEALVGPRGGWPAGLEPGAQEAVPETVEMLFALADLGLSRHSLTRRGLTFLLEQQDPDGGWTDRVPRGDPLPRWQRQGEEASRLYLTAWTSSVLVAYGCEEEEPVTRALDMLLKWQLEGGVFAGFPRHTAWYALPLLARRLGRRSGPALNIIRTLSLAMREPGWFASMFASLLHNLLLAGYRLETPLARLAWEQLLLRQEENGSWASEEGESDAVRTTLEVLWCWRQVTLPT